jgi:hypothetical protein
MRINLHLLSPLYTRSRLLPRGCVLSFGVVVGQGVSIQPYTRLSRISKTEAAAAGDNRSDSGDSAASSNRNDDEIEAGASPMVASFLDAVGSTPWQQEPSETPPPAKGAQHEVAGYDGFGYVWTYTG